MTISRLGIPYATTGQRNAVVPNAHDIIHDTTLNKVFVGDGVSTGGIDISGGRWGEITGTLSDQTQFSDVSTLGTSSDKFVSERAIKVYVDGQADLNNKVGVDSGATPDFLGAASNDGVLRTSADISYTDGGDFVTLGLANSYALNATLANYTTNTELSNTLAAYALTSTLANYVTDTELTNTLAPYALTATLANYALTSTLANYALTSTLANYVTNSELTNTLTSYALTSTLANYVTDSELTNTLSAYALTATLSNYALNSTLANYLK